MSLSKNIFRILVVVLVASSLMSCVTRHNCPTKIDANGNEYLDRNACSETTYIAGIIPLK